MILTLSIAAYLAVGIAAGVTFVLWQNLADVDDAVTMALCGWMVLCIALIWPLVALIGVFGFGVALLARSLRGNT